MKIPLQYINGTIFLSALLRAQSYRVLFKGFAFVVDTGSPKTFISEKEALQFQIPTRALSFKEYIRLGGSKFEILTGKKGELYFKTDDGRSKKYDFSVVVVKTTRTTREGIQESRSCPSILGTDFLTQHNLGLVFRPAQGVYYLEGED